VKTLSVSLLILVAAAGSAPCEPLQDLWPIPDFSLKTSEGTTLSNRDLDGKVWVAAFIFTRCGGPCPHVTANMKRLQDDLKKEPNFRLVTVTVDPEHDTPDVLKQYAQGHDADTERWSFLTGDKKDVYALIVDGFKLYAGENKGSDRTAGNEFVHTTKLALVDKNGHLRGVYDGGASLADNTPNTEIDKLEYDAKRLLHEHPPGWSDDLPMVNAILNATSAVLILLGFGAILTGRINLHKTCMTSAFVVSTIFLASYLYYHIIVREGQVTRFQEQAPTAPEAARDIYRFILLTHTILAAIGAPLVITTLTLGWTNKLIWHMRFARWTLPIWLYVSVTGVVVYLMLYRLYPAS
jgi:protein SCO1/2/putative membrane protein